MPSSSLTGPFARGWSHGSPLRRGGSYIHAWVKGLNPNASMRLRSDKAVRHDRAAPRAGLQRGRRRHDSQRGTSADSRPGRGRLLALAPFAEAAPLAIPEGTPNGFTVQRGTNISHWLSQSRRRGEERQRYFTEEDMTLIARLGYDHVRLPVDEEQLWDESGHPEEEAFALLESALDWAAARELPVIVDLHILRSHHFNEGEKPLWTDPKEQERFVDVWRRLSDRLKARPNDQVAYELMNEAVADDPEDWNRLLARAFQAVREREPERTIVIGSNKWQQVETFDQLRIPEGDPNILLSFHLYTPMALTHYGASWTKVGEYEGPVRYPGVVVTEDDLAGLPDDLVGAIRDGRGLYFDRTVLEEKLTKPLALARKAHLPLYCGEWGALPSVPRADRLRWYRTSGASSRATESAGRTGTTRAASGWSTTRRTSQVDLAQALLGEDVILTAIESGDLGIFQGETEIGAVERGGATVFDQGRAEYRVSGGGENIGELKTPSTTPGSGSPGTSSSPRTSVSWAPDPTSTARPGSWCGPLWRPTRPTSTPPFTGRPGLPPVPGDSRRRDAGGEGQPEGLARLTPPDPEGRHVHPVRRAPRRAPPGVGLRHPGPRGTGLRGPRRLLAPDRQLGDGGVLGPGSEDGLAALIPPVGSYVARGRPAVYSRW